MRCRLVRTPREGSQHCCPFNLPAPVGGCSQYAGTRAPGRQRGNEHGQATSRQIGSAHSTDLQPVGDALAWLTEHA